MVTKPQVAFITGGASGMGLAVVEDLVSKGWNVAVFDFSEEAGNAVAERLGERVRFIKGNVVVYNELVAAFDQVFKLWGQIDFVYANAGVGERGDLYAPPPEGQEWPTQPSTLTIDVNLFGVVWTSHLALHAFRKNASKSGKLVMTASSAALYPSGPLPLYAATKHAVVGLTRAMAQALKYRKEAITVNCLCPGVVPSGLMPQTVVDNMPKEMVTWPSTMVKAINQFLADDSITGEAAECSGEDVIYRPAYAPENDAAKYMLSGAAFASVDFGAMQQHADEKAKHYTVMEKAVAVSA